MSDPARSGRAARGAAALPAIAFMALFFVVPIGVLLSASVMTGGEGGRLGLPLTLEHYRRILDVPLYQHVLWTTLRISALTMIAAAVIGYPVALVMVRGTPWVARLVSAVVIAPLVVSVVVRTYGWQLILANSKAGLLNWALGAIGLGAAPVRVMYTEFAVVIGSLHVNLPLMVLPLAAALAKADPSLEEAARTLGAPSWRVFRHVTLPLSLPGLVAGCTLVFALTASSYVTPAILGGANGQMIGTLIQEQVMAIFDWSFGSALAVVLVVAILVVQVGSVVLLRAGRRLRWRPA